MTTRLCLLVLMVVPVRTTWKVGHVHVADDEGRCIIGTHVCFLSVLSCASLPFSCCAYYCLFMYYGLSAFFSHYLLLLFLLGILLCCSEAVKGELCAVIGAAFLDTLMTDFKCGDVTLLSCEFHAVCMFLPHLTSDGVYSLIPLLGGSKHFL